MEMAWESARAPNRTRRTIEVTVAVAVWIALGFAFRMGVVAYQLTGAAGVPFSIYWRRSGNLLVPGVPHALIDAVRNALMVLPWR